MQVGGVCAGVPSLFYAKDNRFLSTNHTAKSRKYLNVVVLLKADS